MSLGEALEIARMICGVIRPCPSCGTPHYGACADAWDCDELGIDEDDYPWL